jgi:membrane protein implicated in regulation of membrane protease activity
MVSNLKVLYAAGFIIIILGSIFTVIRVLHLLFYVNWLYSTLITLILAIPIFLAWYNILKKKNGKIPRIKRIH